MKIELNGQLTKNIEKINDLKELNDIRTNIIDEQNSTDRKVKLQLLDLALGIINKRIGAIAYDLAYANEIDTEV